MSFESLPPEMLMKVFLFVTDIRYKLRLQRVNKQWFTCIRSPQSWALNTRLSIKMGPTTPVFCPFKQHRENMALLEYAPKITFLKFHGTSEDPKYDDSMMAKMWANEHKLRLEHLEIMNTDHNPCRSEYTSLVIRLMSLPSMKSVEFFCCLSPVCRLRDAFAQQLRLRPGLRKLKWRSLPLAARGTVSAALKDLPFESLRLEIQGTSHEWLATVVNAAKDSSVRELEIPEDVETFKERELNKLLRALSPSATDAIKVLKLEGGVSDLFKILPTLPTTFPNLTRLEATYSKALPAPRIAKKIGDLIRCGSSRDVPLDAWIRIVTFGKRQFSCRLWGAIGKLKSARKSGTKRAIGAKRWKRILEENNVKVCIENEWDIE